MRRLILLLGVLALTATACGSGVEEGNYKKDAGLNTAPECPKTVVTATANAGKKPEVTIKNDNCSPPKTLETTTVIPGKGAVLKAGDTASIQYVGISWSTKKQFDASWDGGKPFETQIPGQLIPGWNEAIPGMRIGERRILIIPPAQAYGSTGQGPIAPNETLVFVVDLLGTKPGPKPTQSTAPGNGQRGTPSGTTSPGKAKGTPTGAKPKPKKSAKPTPVLSKIPRPSPSPSRT
ncbi:MAG: hypothetical protein NVSMB57_00100 [Actinomycetota bacterium]